MWFVQCSEHGFPQKPSAFAYDPLLSLLAVGTENGNVRMYADTSLLPLSLSTFVHSASIAV